MQAKKLDRFVQCAKFIHFDSTIEARARNANAQALKYTFSDGSVKAVNNLINAAELGHQFVEIAMEPAKSSGLFSSAKLTEMVSRLGINR